MTDSDDKTTGGDESEALLEESRQAVFKGMQQALERKFRQFQSERSAHAAAADDEKDELFGRLLETGDELDEIVQAMQTRLAARQAAGDQDDMETAAKLINDVKIALDELEKEAKQSLSF